MYVFDFDQDTSMTEMTLFGAQAGRGEGSQVFSSLKVGNRKFSK